MCLKNDMRSLHVDMPGLQIRRNRVTESIYDLYTILVFDALMPKRRKSAARRAAAKSTRAGLQKAARKGDSGAIFELAVHLLDGGDGRPDAVAAATWLQVAARSGHAEAQLRLGTLYATGHGVELELAEAAKWMCLAAEQGVARAQYWMAKACFLGTGVERNPTAAYRWACAAVAQGFGDPGEIRAAARPYIGDAERERIEREFTPLPAARTVNG